MFEEIIKKLNNIFDLHIHFFPYLTPEDASHLFVNN
jgi:hypothetical protein